MSHRRISRYVAALLATALALVAVNHAAETTTPRPAPPKDTRASADPGGKWRLSVATSASDGSKAVTARLEANAPIPSGFGQTTPVLVLKYHAGRITAFVAFDTYLGDGRTDAMVTFGHGKPETQSWDLSEDGRTAFAPGDALGFLQQLTQSSSFSIGVTPHHARPVVAAFTTTGVDLVTKALISAGVKFSN